MKREFFKILTFIFLIVSINQAIGQSEKVFIGLSVGPSIPLSDYKSTDLSKEESGFAKVGFNFNISVAYRLSRNFSLAALVTGSTNSINRSALQDEITDMNKGDLPNTSWSVEAGTWGIGGILIGGLATLPLSDRFFLDFRALCGIYTAYSPEYTLYANTIVQGSPVTYTFEREKYHGTSFAYNFGTGFKYKMGNKYLIFNVDYTASKPKFKDVKIHNIDGTINTQTFKQDINSLNVTIGMGYYL